jgi:hypothetical protein
MDHISDTDLERYYLGMVPEDSDEEREIEEHLLWCQECLKRVMASDCCIDALRVA